MELASAIRYCGPSPRPANRAVASSSAQSSRAVPSHQKCMPSGVAGLRPRLSVSAMPETGETTSTRLMLKNPW